MKIYPSLEQAEQLVKEHNATKVPIYGVIPADLLTPSIAYLKLSQGKRYSYILESVSQGENVSRYSFIGSPYRVLMANGFEDPLARLERELKEVKVAPVPGLPSFSGGAVGYVSYDCIKYFEPTTNVPAQDTLNLPEALFFMTDDLIAFDHAYQTVKIISHICIDQGRPVEEAYEAAMFKINMIHKKLDASEIPLPPQKNIHLGYEAKSNTGEEGYKNFVSTLKKHIHQGDIFQAVPSQRLSRPTDLHPFNLYRHLRTVNPSPYMFYLNCDEFDIIGASPELLVKSEDGRIINHPIAGTVPRGKTQEQDEALANELLSSVKDRAEHVMLVDLARNDVNRVCNLDTTHVDRLMTIEKFSHVQHLVSQVSGVLREGKTRFDAFRSIFPAGTVSGSPKVRAIQLVAGLEKEKRGIYAGAVGHWGYKEDQMDTCIAIRTMVYKDGVLHLQAGGGIVFDSDEQAEYIETINKLRSNVTAIDEAEKLYAKSQNE
ncbi:anthranilate synthase component I [Schizosaccharomyces cryophilus OY26]|uniref:anthranilate synthase n=1 Tax=Schizosaccharomyces cryophilus (strain OY26 / ATCC MYA-4695 / CBS 11777 / NBRC 106824 / NRRL Y48691) TaxID=653667 RepID=S9W0R0_SCHCR|nr:anthranilate synthase component I [Schizosaccharomyces cryophilus OY26]EPY52004.1 anthranilate synthase component I [Schizosaccharomyces cryophilus OY26]